MVQRFWVSVLCEVDKYDIQGVRKSVDTYLKKKISEGIWGNLHVISKFSGLLNMRELVLQCRQKIQEIIAPSDPEKDPLAADWTEKTWKELEDSVCDYPTDILADLFSSTVKVLTDRNLQQKRLLDQKQYTLNCTRKECGSLRQRVHRLEKAIDGANAFVSKRRGILCSKDSKQPGRL